MKERNKRRHGVSEREEEVSERLKGEKE